MPLKADRLPGTVVVSRRDILESPQQIGAKLAEIGFSFESDTYDPASSYYYMHGTSSLFTSKQNVILLTLNEVHYLSEVTLNDS